MRGSGANGRPQLQALRALPRLDIAIVRTKRAYARRHDVIVGRPTPTRYTKSLGALRRARSQSHDSPLTQRARSARRNFFKLGGLEGPRIKCVRVPLYVLRRACQHEGRGARESILAQ